jgi:hypothetical protein
MPPAAYALVTLFVGCSVVLGVAATRLARSIGGPRRRLANVVPVLAGFGAFYLIGHRLGLSVGPKIPLFGFQVALLGDVAIGFLAALVAAAAQAVVVRGWRGRRGGQVPEVARRSS